MNMLIDRLLDMNTDIPPVVYIIYGLVYILYKYLDCKINLNFKDLSYNPNIKVRIGNI